MVPTGKIAIGKALMLTGLGLVLGGALVNFLDRALYGQVVDFLQFTFEQLRLSNFQFSRFGHRMRRRTYFARCDFVYEK